LCRSAASQNARPAGDVFSRLVVHHGVELLDMLAATRARHAALFR